MLSLLAFLENLLSGGGQSKVVPRYWIVVVTDAASSLCLLGKITIISFALLTSSSRCELSHTNSRKAGPWGCEESDNRDIISMMNSRGERTQPCRTPLRCVGVSGDFVCDLQVRKSRSHRISWLFSWKEEESLLSRLWGWRVCYSCGIQTAEDLSVSLLHPWCDVLISSPLTSSRRRWEPQVWGR